jgi:GTP-binding protein
MGGTTRDAIDCEVTVDGEKFIVIDTAGIRRRGKIEQGPEALSVHSSFRAIDRSDVVLLVLDSEEGITLQDQHVAGYILEREKACIILLNKWDLVPDREAAFGKLIGEVRRQFAFMKWAPIMTISARTGQRTHKIWGLIRHCAENYRRQFKTRELNLILKQATAYLSPPTARGNQLALKYITQTRTAPPTLTVFVNDPKLVHFSYHRFLLNQFHAALNLEGTPLIMRFRRKAPPRGWERVVRQMTSGYIPSEHPAIQEDEEFTASAFIEAGDGYETRRQKIKAAEDAAAAEKYYAVDDDDDDGEVIEYSLGDDDDEDDEEK